MADPAQVLVIGSANLDVLSRVAPGGDNREHAGHSVIEVGGAAAKVAMCLEEIGVHCRLLTALNTSIYSTLVEKHLTDRGIAVKVVREPSLETALYSAHLDVNGEVRSSVASTPIENVDLDQEVISENVSGCQAVVIDSNLSPVTITSVADVTHRLGIPLYAMGTSARKAMKLRSIAVHLDGIFLAQDEGGVIGALKWDNRERKIGKDGTVSIERHPDVMIVFRPGDVATVIDGESNYYPVSGVMTAAIEERLGEGKHQAGYRYAFAAAYLYRHVCCATPQRRAVTDAMETATKMVLQAYTHRRNEPEAIESLVHDLANRDHLTNAMNRAGSASTLDRYVQSFVDGEVHALCVLMIDIDNFKSVNDTYGHPAGDTVIVTVASIIRGLLRGSDALGRWGGEEFLVMLPNASGEVAANVAERIRTSVEHFTAAVDSKMPRPITVSIGVASLDAGMDPDMLVELADRALYAAKQSGRNRVEVAAGAPALQS